MQRWPPRRSASASSAASWPPSPPRPSPLLAQSCWCAAIPATRNLYPPLIDAHPTYGNETLFATAFQRIRL